MKTQCLSLAPALHTPDQNIEEYASRSSVDNQPHPLTLDRLAWAAENRMAVICPGFPCWNKPKPAAFVIQLSGAILHHMLKQGLFIYQKAKKGKRS